LDRLQLGHETAQTSAHLDLLPDVDIELLKYETGVRRDLRGEEGLFYP
jgi:hypothetical protein